MNTPPCFNTETHVQYTNLVAVKMWNYIYKCHRHVPFKKYVLWNQQLVDKDNNMTTILSCDMCPGQVALKLFIVTTWQSFPETSNIKWFIFFLNEFRFRLRSSVKEGL